MRPSVRQARRSIPRSTNEGKPEEAQAGGTGRRRIVLLSGRRRRASGPAALFRRELDDLASEGQLTVDSHALDCPQRASPTSGHGGLAQVGGGAWCPRGRGAGPHRAAMAIVIGLRRSGPATARVGWPPVHRRCRCLAPRQDRPLPADRRTRMISLDGRRPTVERMPH